MTKTLTGSCLCGQVTYKAEAEPVFAAHCHCDDCRKNTGAGYAPLVFVPAESLTWQGETRAYTHTADSGSIMTKHFCTQCGTQLFGSNANRNDRIHIKVGTLDDASWFQPWYNVFASRRLPSTPINTDVPDADKMPQPKPQS